MTKDKPMVRLRMRVWLEAQGGMLMGLGRAELLRAIQETGSLNKAAAVLGMSYRAAWGRLKKSESLFGLPLVRKTGARQGFELTDEARALVESYNAWHADLERYALQTAQDRFPFDIVPFGPFPDGHADDGHEEHGHEDLDEDDPEHGS